MRVSGPPSTKPGLACRAQPALAIAGGRGPRVRELFTREEFSYDPDAGLCVCPAGHELYRNGKHMLFNGDRVAHFKAPLRACRDCKLRPQCLRYPERTPQRQITIIENREGLRNRSGLDDGRVARMKLKLLSARGREICGRRLGTVEPVFRIASEGVRALRVLEEPRSGAWRGDEVAFVDQEPLGVEHGVLVRPSW
jgi:hypothetical protein